MEQFASYMRYWIYKDARILGPLTKEDLGMTVGLHPDTLVCPEDSGGGGDIQWKCVEDVPELAGICVKSSMRLGEDVFADQGFGNLECLHNDSLAFSDQVPADALVGKFFSSGAKSMPPPIPPADDSTRQELGATQKCVKDLAEQIHGIGQRLVGLEVREARSARESASPFKSGENASQHSQALGKEVAEQIQGLVRRLSELEERVGQEAQPAIEPAGPLKPGVKAPQLPPSWASELVEQFQSIRQRISELETRQTQEAQSASGSAGSSSPGANAPAPPQLLSGELVEQFQSISQRLSDLEARQAQEAQSASGSAGSFSSGENVPAPPQF
ncbi:MAG TPA: hypothetical protein DEB40_11315, partial [Elusimicrobia bacterium]|nr:hypothetical protein [Elusimicrobiota bacterium]HBT62321.1 hypothetical protein [Elusimicrobiota bacterium]